MRKLLTTITLATAVALIGCNESGPVASDTGGSADLASTAACTPGFWRNNLTVWPASFPMGPNDDWQDAVPGLARDVDEGPDVTLLEGLSLGGDKTGVNIYTQISIAAIISAYAQCGGPGPCMFGGGTVPGAQGIIDEYNARVAAGVKDDIIAYKDLLDDYLNSGVGCLLDGDGNDDH